MRTPEYTCEDVTTTLNWVFATHPNTSGYRSVKISHDGRVDFYVEPDHAETATCCFSTIQQAAEAITSGDLDSRKSPWRAIQEKPQQTFQWTDNL